MAIQSNILLWQLANLSHRCCVSLSSLGPLELCHLVPVLHLELPWVAATLQLVLLLQVVKLEPVETLMLLQLLGEGREGGEGSGREGGRGGEGKGGRGGEAKEGTTINLSTPPQQWQ